MAARVVLCMLSALVVVGAGEELAIVVVEQDPQLALELQAAALAGLATEAYLARREAEDTGIGEGEEREEFKELDLVVKTESVDPGSLLDVPQSVCEVATQTGVRAVLAGVSSGMELAAAAAARAGVSLLLAGEAGDDQARWSAVAMRPRASLALLAARALVREKGWERAALLHAGSASPAALLAPTADQIKLFVRQLPDDDVMLRGLMLTMKKAQYVNFLVWGDAEATRRVLDASQRVGLLSTAHSYILLTYDLHTLDLHDYSHGAANVTGLMFFNPTLEPAISATNVWREKYAELLMDVPDKEEREKALARSAYSAATIPCALLLAHDAALLAARALRRMRLPPQLDDTGDCDTGRGAFYADTLINYIRAEEEPLIGATGILTWELDGWRQRTILQVAELQRGGALSVTGTWSEREGVLWARHDPPAKPLPTHTMMNRTFTVIISVIAPYVMEKVSTEKQTGNNRYEGFCIELIQELAEALHFNYTFVEQEDKEYGKYNTTLGRWVGMLGSVMEDETNLTLAITDLTITEQRERVVDFTTPFMNLGIAILFHKPKTPDPKFFAFLLPFSRDVWAYLGLAYIGSSLMLYVVGRLCPEEWQNPYPCIEEPEALENQFTLGNALWFNLGAILLQGSEVAPVGYSTRAVASVWWLFALVITSSYTANLATLLAQISSNDLIKDVHDLVNNDLGITYGAKKTGSTYAFFENSQKAEFQEMYRNMRNWEMPKDNDAGIRNVSESFAFLMESTSIEYVEERNCSLYKVGDLLDSKGYGIAMRKGSPYRQELNLALLKMQEAGRLREMKHTWWEERNGGGACKKEEERPNKAMEMNSFYGLFIVLVTGCGIGLLLSCGDLALHARAHPRRPDRSFFTNFADELRFVFRFELSTKPVQGPLIPVKTPSIPAEPEEVETEVDAVAAEEGGDETGAGGDGEEAGRSGSALSGPRRRRRSSMHNASLRLARHLHSLDAGH